MFEIKKRDGLARIGEFTTPSGTVETPAIMPVINPNFELISTEKLKEEFDIQVLITNSYIIYQSEELKEEALEEGIHSMLDFSGPIMTDSGTFQSHVYGDVVVEPEEILSFQKKIGSDISTILDEFTEPDETELDAEKKMEKTVQRAKKAKEEFAGKEGHTAFPIQGSVYPHLRERCGELMKELDGDFYPIGGVVPLMEDYKFSELVKVIVSSKKGLGAKGPVHLFGAGHPMIYSLAVLLGCDLFDSSSYAKYAKRGDLMYPEGTKNLSDLEHLGCECPVCTSHTTEELKDLSEDKREELLAEHNLWISRKEMEKVKQSIVEGTLWELVERRVRGHPELLKTLKVLDDRYEYLEKFEPRSRKRALFDTGSETYWRPAIKRIQDWIMSEYEPPADGPTILFEMDQDKKPYNRHLREELGSMEDHELNYLVETPIGPVPLEMDEIYPVAQSIFSSDKMPEKLLTRYKERKDIDNMIRWEGKKTLDSLSQPHQEGISFDEMKIKTTADYQFCKEAGKVLTDGTLEFVKNNKGRIKNVMLDGEHILSVRHYDGFFTLKKPGAQILWAKLSSPKMRIEVTDESAKFNSEGKNVFAKFVTEMSGELRPGDEAIVVTQDDEIAATARVFLTKEEVQAFKRGLAARTREGFET
ncbi:MAG: tRNA guanosine(15) transglycosylase TgtA [Candidatus Thermoplasmatota archaeon]|nr:tRNA guanosine(15) transglycosylase TgtA [Candidatus Thermoplasmatota archaeon]